MTSTGGAHRPLTADLARELERTFMERLSARVVATRRFRDPASGAGVKGSAHRDSAFPRDFGMELRRILRGVGAHDPVLWSRLPKGARARFVVRRGFFPVRRTVMVIGAAVVHPFAGLARGGACPELDPGEVAEWLPPDPPKGIRRVGAVLSTSGWKEADEPATWAGAPAFLFEPATGGGFRASNVGYEEVPGYLALDSEKELAERVGAYVEASRAELVLRGLVASRAAEETGVPEDLVRTSFERIAASEEFLHLAREGGALVLRRS